MDTRHAFRLRSLFRIALVLGALPLSPATAQRAEGDGGRQAPAAVSFIPLDLPMRDGKSLAADLYASDSSIAKPVILIQTPYNKNNYRLTFPRSAGPSFPGDTAKYHYVILDWRGFYGSKAADVKGYDRGLDGYDAVEWIAAQGWCNGKVGTWGPSALGQAQFSTARRQPPHLVCSVPLVKDYKSKYTDSYYGGDYRKEHVETLEKLGFLAAQTILSQPVYNAIWKTVERTNDYPEDIAVPMLLISGWFDHFPDDVLRAFADLRARSDASVRGLHKLIMGPWLHGDVGAAAQGELTFPNAVDEAKATALQFFGTYLLGEKTGYPLLPAVRYYQMGANEWRSTPDWNSVGSSTRTLYLHQGGVLQPEAPVEASASAVFRYDPRDPSPAYGSARFNPFDPTVKSGPLDIRSVVESRNDALVFSTPPLTAPVEIDGPVNVTLHMSSDRLDTDLSARVCDVYPDGRSMIMADGIIRARFRNGVDRQELLLPGQATTAVVAVQNLALTLLPGHRLRVVVASADYPRFDRNLNNGGTMYAEGDTLIATNTIFFDASHPSSLTFATPAATPVQGLAAVPRATPSIGANYPNPFRARTMIPVAAAGAHGEARVFVADLLGREVATLYRGAASALPPALSFDATGLAPGVYRCSMESAGGGSSRLMAVIP